MLFYESDSLDPAWNLALEEVLFQTLPEGRPCLYLWRNSPSVIIGKNQCAVDEVDRSFLEAHGIRLVRRLSGGGAVYHDPGNLNYSVILDMDSPTADDFFFSYPVIRALAALGIHAVRSGRNDLLIDGKKFGGCASYEKDGRLLRHGCIMLDTDLEMLQRALTVHPDKLRSHGIPSVRSRVTTIAEYMRQHEADKTANDVQSANSDPDDLHSARLDADGLRSDDFKPDCSGTGFLSPDCFNILKASLRKEFARAFSGQSAPERMDGSADPMDAPCSVLELSAESLSRVQHLADSRYRSPVWNEGREEAAEAGDCKGNAPTRILREYKYESGLVSVRMEILDQRIHRIRIRGDFFGSADISILEHQMEGLPLDEHLGDRLRELPVETCMHGIRAEDLARLLE